MKIVSFASIVVFFFSGNSMVKVRLAQSLQNKTWYFVVKQESSSGAVNRNFVASKRDGSVFYHKLQLSGNRYNLDGVSGSYLLEASNLILKAEPAGNIRRFKVLFQTDDYLTLQSTDVEVGIFYCVQAPK